MPAVDSMLANVILKWDQFFFQNFLGNVTREVLCPMNYLTTGLKYVDTEIPSLVVLCSRVVSGYNLGYGGTSEHPYVTNVVYNVQRNFRARLDKFPRKFPSFRPGFDFEDVNRGLNFFYCYCVRSKKKVRFTFKPSDMNLIPLGPKKNGYDKWPTIDPIKTELCEVHFTKHPSKNQAACSILRDFSNFVLSAAQMIKGGSVPIEKKFKQFITSLSFKDENRSCIDEGTLNPEKVKDYAMKGRIFALYKDSVIGRLTQFRKIERTYYPDFDKLYPGSRNLSAHIEIGTSWMYGGAYMKYFALFGDLGDKYKPIFRDNDPTFITYEFVESGTQKFFDGDIKALDTSIGAMHLVMYQMFCLVWLLRDDNDPMYLLIKCIVEGLAEMLAGKTVKWLEDFMLIVGFMPSGSLETSHGNSWIMINFYWFGYIFNVLFRVSRDERRKIWDYLIARRLAGLFFGDDYLGSAPRDLDSITNEGFAEYINAKYGVEMKSNSTYYSLLTYLKVASGTCLQVIYRGPIYLKRHFILSQNFHLQNYFPGICEVVPWRPIYQYKWRMSVCADRSAPIYHNLARLIGLAYDTLGVEPGAYYMLKFVYDESYRISVGLRGVEFVHRIIPEDLAKDRKYLLKLGMKDVPKGFPSYSELLYLNHFDREYHKPVYDETRTWQESVLEVETF